MLGEAVRHRGGYAEAEPLLIAGYEGMKSRSAKIPASAKIRLGEAAGRLVDLYNAWGKPDQARAWQAERGRHAMR